MQERQADSKIAVAAQNRFGLRLLELEAARNREKNLFLSPLSVFLALAMTEAGAAGKTRAAMRHALSVPEAASDQELETAASALMHDLQAQRDVVLTIANALWADRKMPLDAAFVEKCQKLFNAQSMNVSFSDAAAAAGQINAWVNDKTQGKIPTIVTPDAVRSAGAVLTNAVYFQGRWREKFRKEDTQDGLFHLTAGKQKKVPFMHQSGLRGAYRSGRNYEGAELRYGYSSTAMYVVLPAPGKSPVEVMAGIDVGALIGGYGSTELELKLPRFTIDFSQSLRPSLEKLGMSVAFHYPGAEFQPMGSPLFYISDVLHKTRLEVDEEGTIAAAASAVIMMVGAGRPQKVEKKQLTVDRPFGVLLCDTQSHAILFAGVVWEP